MTTKLSTRELCVAFSSMDVYDPELTPPYNNWSEQHVLQGFSWREGSVSFATLASLSVVNEIYLADEVEILAKSQRVIQVPFFVGPAGQVALSDICSIDEIIEVPPGGYLLVFENGFRYDVEITAEEEILGLRPMWARLTFVPCASPSAAVLRETPDVGETPLQPRLPLLMQAEAAL